MNLEERVRELRAAGDVEAAKQLIRAAISCGKHAEYRFDGDAVRVSHPAYTGVHAVQRRPWGDVRVSPRGDYLFDGETGSASVELTAMNSRAVQFGRERIALSETANREAPAPSVRGEAAPEDRGANS